jgi:hypothetical protein
MAPLGGDGAKKFRLPPEDAHKWVRIDTAKANYGVTGQTRWFEREIVQLPAVDPRDPTLPELVTVAILRPSLRGPAVGVAGLDLTAIVSAIGAGFEGGPPLSDVRAKESVHTLLKDKFGIERQAAVGLVHQLLQAGVLRVDRRKDTRGGRHERNLLVPAPDWEPRLKAMINPADETDEVVF